MLMTMPTGMIMLFNVHAVLMMKKLSIKHSVLLPPLTMIVAMMATMRGRRTSKVAIMMQALQAARW